MPPQMPPQMAPQMTPQMRPMIVPMSQPQQQPILNQQMPPVQPVANNNIQLDPFGA